MVKAWGMLEYGRERYTSLESNTKHFNASAPNRGMNKVRAA